MNKIKKKETRLYIDGTNLFAGQYELFGPESLSFTYLLDEITKIIQIDKVFFYASYMNGKNRQNAKMKKLVAAEVLFYREVKHNPKVIFYKGHRSPTSGKEKGVDVHLAADIVKDACLGECGQIVIVTGDADLIYPIEIAKNLGIVTYAMFLPNRFSIEMAYKSDKSYLFNFLGKFRVSLGLPSRLKIISIKKPRLIEKRGRYGHSNKNI